MGGGPLKLRIDIGLEPDAAASELDKATLQLRRELLELDVEDVERPTAGPSPRGARAVDAALLGTVIVTAGSELVRAAVQAAIRWFSRRDQTGSIKLEIDGDSIEVTDPSVEDQRRLIEMFLARHAEGRVD
jgi:hypothetical protein